MNMLGDFRYASNEHIGGMGGFNKRKELFKPGGKLMKKIAYMSYGVVKIGNWIFSHGGVLPEHIKIVNKNTYNSSYFFEKVNNLVKNILLGKTRIDDISVQEEEILFGRISNIN